MKFSPLAFLSALLTNSQSVLVQPIKPVQPYQKRVRSWFSPSKHGGAFGSVKPTRSKHKVRKADRRRTNANSRPGRPFRDSNGRVYVQFSNGVIRRMDRVTIPI